jgi:DNA repair exonuclease SbcCD ATPase subunit
MFYVVTINTSGPGVGAEVNDCELSMKVLRLPRKLRNKLMTHKVAVYNWLRKNASFKVDGSHVLHHSKLDEFHRYFTRHKEKFNREAYKIYKELKQRWPEQKYELINDLRKRRHNKKILTQLIAKLNRLDLPDNSEELASINYSIRELADWISPRYSTTLPAEIIVHMEERRKRIEAEIRRQYFDKLNKVYSMVKELEKEIKRLNDEKANVEAELTITGKERVKKHKELELRRQLINRRLEEVERKLKKIRKEAEQIQQEVWELEKIGIEVKEIMLSEVWTTLFPD